MYHYHNFPPTYPFTDITTSNLLLCGNVAFELSTNFSPVHNFGGEKLVLIKIWICMADEMIGNIGKDISAFPFSGN